MSIQLGRFSYAGQVRELFDPEVIVGSFCSIADDVIFMGKNSHHPSVYNRLCVTNYPFKEKWRIDYSPSGYGTEGRGPTTICHDVWIGNGAVIMDGADISSGCIIGARAVIGHTRIPPYAIVIGNPGIIKRYRFSPYIIDRLLAIRWWDWSDARIREAVPYMKDVERFIDMVDGGQL